MLKGFCLVTRQPICFNGSNSFLYLGVKILMDENNPEDKFTLKCANK